MLLIELTVDGIDRSRYRVYCHMQGSAGPWGPRAGDAADVGIEQLEEAVGVMVAGAERAWGEGNAAGQAAIEFLLPMPLLNLPVQWYRAAPRLGLVQPICVRYPVVVRSADRMREDGLRLDWVNRWSLLDRQPFAGEVLWGVRYEARHTDVDSWATELNGDSRYVVVVLSEPPTVERGRAELVAAIAAGVPVILWDQREEPAGKTVDDLLRRLVASEPTKLPAEMRALRVEAERMATHDPDHLGRSVALLWDDPYRVLAEEGAGS